MNKSKTMGYEKVTLVLGTIVTKRELKKYVEFDKESDCFVTSTLGKVLCGKVKIFRLPGHSKMARKTFIVGFQTISYQRNHDVGCTKCEKLSLCDTCVGQTTNGYYDVCRMDEPIEANLRHICLLCNHDNREDLRMAGHPLQFHDIEPKKCKSCGRKPQHPEWEPQKALEWDYRYEQLRKFIDGKETMKDRHIGFYYVTDMCICCT